LLPTKEQILAFVSNFSKDEGAALLLSGGDFSTSERSFIGLFPRKIVSIPAEPVKDPWEILSEKVQNGFWFGYLSYEMGHWSVPKMLCRYKSQGEDLAAFIFCAVIIVIHHQTGTVEVRYQDKLSISEQTRIAPFLNGDYSSLSLSTPQIKLNYPLTGIEEYSELLKHILDWIRDGQVYQVNLSHCVEWINYSDPFQMYCQLFLDNPSPFSAYLHFEKRSIASLSPERFLKLEKGVLSSYPIKGTSARSADPEEDMLNKQYLLTSEKENAELLMITDLMRNDLGRVCLPGSIQVPKVKHCESYNNVFHLNSIIQGSVDKTKNFWEVIYSCFPAGSITGCPKGKAMELINILEKSTRGIYTGSIGYIDFSNGFDLNVAIRTVEIKGIKSKLRLGGGITIDSEINNEYCETLHKGRSFLKFLKLINPP
jgi:para-aminobenzoate synthetase component 1